MYQLIVAPADVAFKFDDEPQEIEDGEAVTGVGAAKGPTVTVTGVRDAATQLAPAAHEITTCPLPEFDPAIFVWLVPPL